MNQGIHLRTLVVVALLLPGLAMAAPVAGPCGLCDGGMACPSMETALAEPSSCCDGGTGEIPQEVPASTMNCDCGREAPPATAPDIAPFDETVSLGTSSETVSVSSFGTDGAVLSAVDAPAPSPPLLFLIDCAFLT